MPQTRAASSVSPYFRRLVSLLYRAGVALWATAALYPSRQPYYCPDDDDDDDDDDESLMMMMIMIIAAQ